MNLKEKNYKIETIDDVVSLKNELNEITEKIEKNKKLTKEDIKDAKIMINNLFNMAMSLERIEEKYIKHMSTRIEEAIKTTYDCLDKYKG